jgi:DNA replication protein DnaC
MTIQQIMPELTTKLRKLELSGILSSLDIRNQEAIDNQMAYTEFLTLLAGDELLARENRVYQRRLKLSNLSGFKTIENFDFKFNPRINQSLIRDLATGRFISEKHPVLIIGPCGTGKSHIAQSLGLCAIRQNASVLWLSQTELLQDLQEAKATGRYKGKIKSLVKIDLLIIDDFGLKPLRNPQDEDLHDLIEKRYETKATIVTSNLALHEWIHAFPNQLLGAATIDRLQHNAYILTLEGMSYRQAKDAKTPGSSAHSIADT